MCIPVSCSCVFSKSNKRCSHAKYEPLLYPDTSGSCLKLQHHFCRLNHLKLPICKWSNPSYSLLFEQVKYPPSHYKCRKINSIQSLSTISRGVLNLCPFLFGTFWYNESILVGYIPSYHCRGMVNWAHLIWKKNTMNMPLGFNFDPQACTCFGWPTAYAYNHPILNTQMIMWYIYISIYTNIFYQYIYSHIWLTVLQCDMKYYVHFSRIWTIEL